jgi:hypothetical protein
MGTLFQGWVSFLSLGLVFGCGLPATEADLKLAGVGLDPDSIGALPSIHGGLVEYGLYDFAGGGLPLGMLGLVSYDEVGPSVSFKPPYRMVHGLGFVFQDDVMDPEALFGTLPPPPAAVGFCQTRYEPRSYISAVVDVGNMISFESEDGQSGFAMGRRPFVYPPDMRDVTTYYLEIAPWRKYPRMRPNRVDATNVRPDSMLSTVMSPANFPEGRLVSMDFSGGIPPREASVAAIPMPLAAARANTEVRLPHFPQGVRMSWSGPVYSGLGQVKAAIGDTREEETEDGDLVDQIYDGATWVTVPDNDASDAAKDAFAELMIDVEKMRGSFATCLEYLSHDSVPSEASDCAVLQEPPSNKAELNARGWGHLDVGQLEGQIYTGPWENDGVTFEWDPIETGENELITLTVRFLGPVDFEDENMVEGVVRMSSTDDTVEDELAAWWDELGESDRIPSGLSVPEGRRALLACDDPYSLADPPLIRDSDVETEWLMNDSLLDYRDEPVPSLQGDPGYTLSEVVCRLDESVGSFVLQQAILEEAYNYAQVRGGQGAVFYFSRSTSNAIRTPPVRDAYGHRHDISSLKVVTRAVQMGRFWYGQ